MAWSACSADARRGLDRSWSSPPARSGLGRRALALNGESSRGTKEGLVDPHRHTPRSTPSFPGR